MCVCVYVVITAGGYKRWTSTVISSYDIVQKERRPCESWPCLFCEATNPVDGCAFVCLGTYVSLLWFCNVLKETHDVMKLCEDFPVTVVFKSPVFKIFLNKKIPKRVAQTLGAYSEMLPCVCEREGAILKVSVSFVFNGHLLPSCQARTKCAHTNETAVCFKMPLLCHLKPRLPSHHDPVLKCSRLA